MIFEIGATVFGLIQGVLVMLNKRSNWLFYICQMIFLIIFSGINHLYGDIANNSIYLIMGVIGYIMWQENKASSKITKASQKEKLIYTLLIIAGTIILGNILKSTDDPLPMLDSLTTVSSLIATYYMMKKKIDTWIIWFVNDILYAVEYFILPNQALYLFALNIVWTFLAVASYISWNKLMKGEEKNDQNVLFRNIQSKA